MIKNSKVQDVGGNYGITQAYIIYNVRLNTISVFIHPKFSKWRNFVKQIEWNVHMI